MPEDEQVIQLNKLSTEQKKEAVAKKLDKGSKRLQVAKQEEKEAHQKRFKIDNVGAKLENKRPTPRTPEQGPGL